MPQSEHEVICPSAQFCGARKASMSETGLVFPIHSSMSSNLFNIRTSVGRLASWFGGTAKLMRESIEVRAFAFFAATKGYRPILSDHRTGS
jgi:hypothetical protein